MRKAEAIRKVVLMRHGQSAWNLENRYTGWTDVDLTLQGVDEAKLAGKLLKDKGFEFDQAHTSVLKRAVKTYNTIAEEMGLLWIPHYMSWRLNERSYGALEGLNKAETVKKLGKEKAGLYRHAWGIPPPVDHDDKRHPRFDRKYKDVP